MSAPSLTVYVQGQGSVNADNLNTFEQTCDDAADLRAFVGAPGLQVYMRGFTDPGDGGQGNFYWNASGTGPDDGGITNIVPSNAGSGCWTRLSEGGGGGGAPIFASYLVVSSGNEPVNGRTFAVGSSLTITDGGAGSTFTVGTVALTGDIFTSDNSFVTEITTNAVTYDKIQQSSGSTLIGNSDSGTGNVGEITLGAGLSFSGSTLEVTASSAGGSNTQLQYNNAGAFGGITGATSDGTSVTLTSPTFITPTLGVATATSINKVTITQPASSATLTLVTGSSLITSGAFAITLTSTGTTNVTLPTSGTLVNSAVTTLSSLVSIGTITTGTWTASVIGPAYGGTGVANNASSTLTISGNFGTTLTVTGTTSVTLPTSGTLVNSAVTTLSSLVSIGTITTGTWTASVIGPAYGGTGVANNASSTLTISGNFGTTLTVTGTTSVTLPTSGTLVNTAVTTLSSLVSIGTITTGTWHATAVEAAYGGTGLTTYAVGDIIYASATTPTLSKLAAVATGNALISGGTNTAPSWGKIGLTTHVSGTLAVGNGGTGATTFTANAVLTGNTTSAVNATGVTIDTSNSLYGFWAGENAQTGTTYTVASTDAGKIITLSNASAITVTLPSTINAEFICGWYQKGAGQITFSAQSSGTLRNAHSQSKSFGQYAMGSLYVATNASSNPDWVLSGDTGT